MEGTNTVIGKDGYPMVVNSGGHGDYDRRNDCVEELIVQNTIHAGSNANLEATHRNTANVLNAVADASRDGIRETSRAGSDGVRETSRVGADLSAAVAESRAALERANGEGRLSMSIASGEIRELVSKVAFDNLTAIKDNGFTIREEGCKTREKVLEEAYRTREKSAEQFAALQLQQCKDHAALAAQNAAILTKVNGLKEEICCCIDSATAKSDIKRLETALLDAKFAALGNGNSGK